MASVKRGDTEMSGHNAGETSVNKASEGKQIYTVHLLCGAIYDRESIVGVTGSISVTGIMLGDGHDTATFKSASVGDAVPRNNFGIIAEGSVADDGVSGIRIHIE